MIRSILMVCTGNICRSPLAAAEMLRLDPGLKVASAGTAALVGKPADPYAVAVGRQSGLDLSKHIARQIDDILIHQHELIIVMEIAQFEFVVRRYPHVRGRVAMMDRWGDNAGIPDPFRQPPSVFVSVFEQLQTACAEWHRRLTQFSDK